MATSGDLTAAGAVTGLIAAAGLDPTRVEPPAIAGTDPVLPSVFRVGTAAAACVGATLAVAAWLWRRRGGRPGRPSIDVRQAAISFRSERYLRVDGRPAELWDPLSGDYRALDGTWVRLHCNYAHHRAAAVSALGVPEDRSALAAAAASLPGIEIEERVTGAGGCAAMMRTGDGWRDHPQGRAVAALPLVATQRLGDAPAGPLTGAGRPLAGVRVLDLTRVVAGPGAGRALAALGADVLRVGAAHLPDAELLVIDTGFGKRFCHLDLRTAGGRRTLQELVCGCDVFLQGLRPGALDHHGFSVGEVAALRPGIVHVGLSAYGGIGPWGHRRGFDSLVQMTSGIAWEGGVAAGTGGPRPLPAQALDHGTGWLAALGTLAALARRAEEGGSWAVEVSLARTARWLDGLGRVEGLAAPDPGMDDVADLLETVPTPFGAVAHVRPPGSIGGGEPRWESPPHRPGQDSPAW